MKYQALTLADPGGAPQRVPPQQDQFLSFSHTFLLKSVRVRGWRPPNGSAPPQQEILDLPLIKAPLFLCGGWWWGAGGVGVIGEMGGWWCVWCAGKVCCGWWTKGG